MLHVECSNYFWTTNKQQARSFSTPLKQTTRIYAHIRVKNYEKLLSAFHNLFDYSRFTIQKWFANCFNPKSWNIVETKGPWRRVQEQQGNVGWPKKPDIGRCYRWPGCEVTLLMLSYCWCFSWAIGSWNPIIYKVLAPSKRWLFGISEPSTARHVRSCKIFKDFCWWIS